MAIIGHSLESFSVFLDHFPVPHVSFSNLPSDLFHGIETSLDDLDILYSKLESVPMAVCHLRNMHARTNNQ